MSDKLFPEIDLSTPEAQHLMERIERMLPLYASAGDKSNMSPVMQNILIQQSPCSHSEVMARQYTMAIKELWHTLEMIEITVRHRLDRAAMRDHLADRIALLVQLRRAYL